MSWLSLLNERALCVLFLFWTVHQGRVEWKGVASCVVRSACLNWTFSESCFHQAIMNASNASCLYVGSEPHPQPVFLPEATGVTQ